MYEKAMVYVALSPGVSTVPSSPRKSCYSFVLLPEPTLIQSRLRSQHWIARGFAERDAVSPGWYKKIFDRIAAPTPRDYRYTKTALDPLLTSRSPKSGRSRSCWKQSLPSELRGRSLALATAMIVHAPPQIGGHNDVRFG